MGVSIDQLQVLGRYSLSSWFAASKGDFNVTIIGVFAEAEGHFVVDADGFLKVDKIDINLKFEDIKMDFENVGLFGRFLQVTHE